MRWVLLLLAGCQVGPFVPAGSPPCDSDAECPVGTHCAFPSAGSHARCMPGSSDVDSYPPDEMRRDGGR